MKNIKNKCGIEKKQKIFTGECIIKDIEGDKAQYFSDEYYRNHLEIFPFCHYSKLKMRGIV